MTEQQELDVLRKQFIEEQRKENKRLQEAARAYYQRRLNGQPASMRSIVREFNVSYWRLQKIVGGTQTLIKTEE